MIRERVANPLSGISGVVKGQSVERGLGWPGDVGARAVAGGLGAEFPLHAS
jgi:hypothetical protein